MKMIGKVFADNFHRLRGNIIAIVIMCGLALLPALYAWFSLLAFWNPEDNTGNVDVAVANSDAGYQSDLIPTEINAGNEIVSDLRANDKFHWIFVDENEAIEGVKAGQYYAAIVIGQDFSKDMVSIFSDKMENPSIQYYVNEKENPIAPHLTSIGASTIQNDIDKEFSQTLTNVALSTNSNLSKFLNGEGIAAYANSLVSHLDSAVEEMNMDASQIRAFSSLLKQSETLITTATSALNGTGEIADRVRPLVNETSSGLDSAISGTEGFAALASAALDEAHSSLSRIEVSANSAFATLEGAPATIQNTISTMREDLTAAKQTYQQARDAVAAINPSSPVLSTIDAIISEIDQLDAELGTISSEVTSSFASIQDARTRVLSAINDSVAALDKVQADYENTLKQQAENLKTNLSKLGTSAETIARELDETATKLSDSSKPLVQSIDSVRSSLDKTATVLERSATELATSRDEIATALSSNDLEEVRHILGENSDTLAQALTSPVELDRHEVYAIANYGSAMSPFYTSLALFIGAIFLLIILNTKLSPERRAQLGNPKPYQEYFGNLGFFMVVALVQALIICTGNLFYLGIQYENIALYYLTGLTCSFVFMNMLYALVVAFGDVGKGIAVILLVMQVAGSGGELPIQLSAQIFQDLYPWLPFTHSMNLFQGAIAGIYGNQFLVSYVCLLAFVIPALILGLVLRKPIVKLNDFVDEQLDKTGVL